MVHLRLLIPQGAISDFCSKYILTKTLAKQLGTSARYLTNILEMEGIAPTPESVSHLKPSHYVFNRSDVDRINLRKLIKTKRKGISSNSQLLDTNAAAQFVHTQPSILSDLAANGVITTWSSRTRQLLDKNCFRETQLSRLIGKVDKYVGLVSANIAAQMCGRSVSNFNGRLVKSNALAVVHVDGDRRRFFRKSNVEKVVAEMKNLVGAADVRATLNLGETQLIRLTESGELKPVSGPNVDGFGHNLFSKHDVEIVRKQRESFKRRRASEGGSERFGKPAGPTRSPVMEMIAPRVNELLAKAKTRGRRLSGGRLHRILVNEGYKVGVASVYVCLLKSRTTVQ
jgi:hypothetical protein